MKKRGICIDSPCQHDCSGDFCKGLGRFSASNQPLVTLRPALQHMLPLNPRPHGLLLVQRGRRRSRRLLAPEAWAKAWPRLMLKL